MSTRPTTLMEAIKAAKAKKLDKKLRNSDYTTRRALQMEESAMLARSSDPEVLTAHVVSTLYYDMLATYHGKANHIITLESKKSVAFWKRVTASCAESGVSSTDYIKAQFDWFDRHLKCPPPLPSLCTKKAIERAQAFTGRRKDPVGQVEYKSEEASVLKYYDEQIRQICKAQGLTKKEFYLQLVIPGNYPIPDVYLKICPIWKALNNG